MMIRRTTLPITALLPLALLAACSGGADDDASPVETVVANEADPALTAALQDQIMVDPSLGQQANGDAVRPPSRPYSGGVPPEGVAASKEDLALGDMMKAPAPVPAGKDCAQCSAARESATLGGLAARQKNGATSGCAANIEYSAKWAERLPADLPLFPRARVIEAAGTQGGSCALRVVSFSTGVGVDTVVDWYYTKAVRAGYSAEHQIDGTEHILGGTRDRDDSAYVLFLTPRQDGGTDVDLVANRGT